MIFTDLQNLINKPNYFFRPGQALLRLKRLLSKRQDDLNWAQTVLPWGLPIRYHPADMIGSSIFRTGLYDLCVSEAIWRLLENGEKRY